MNKPKLIAIFIIGLIIGLAITNIYAIYNQKSNNCTVEPYFSPSSDDRLINLINSAENSIKIETYVLTNENVIKALINAKQKGVNVQVILDPSIEINKEHFLTLTEAGVQVKWASEYYESAHAKLIIIDNKKLFIGSSNLTYYAFTKNRETNAIITNCNINEYIKIFEKDWKIAG